MGPIGSVYLLGLVVPALVVRLSLNAPEARLVVQGEVASTTVQAILSAIAIGVSIVLVILSGWLLVLFVLLGLLVLLLLWLPQALRCMVPHLAT